MNYNAPSQRIRRHASADAATGSSLTNRTGSSLSSRSGVTDNIHFHHFTTPTSVFVFQYPGQYTLNVAQNNRFICNSGQTTSGIGGFQMSYTSRGNQGAITGTVGTTGGAVARTTNNGIDVCGRRKSS